MRPLKGKRMNRVEPARNLLILQETSQQDPSDWIAIKQRIDRDAPDIEVRIANVGHSLLLTQSGHWHAAQGPLPAR
jgi:hypothetical protein